jgi:N-acetylmuramate 1-kinase
MSEKDGRLEKILHWLEVDLGLPLESLEATAGDASFRRYFRAVVDGVSYIVMDAPVDLESVAQFVTVARLFERAGIHVPAVYEEDTGRGFLLLGDLGRRCYLDHLNEGSSSILYGDALNALVRLQSGVAVEGCPLPFYQREKMRSEMDLFQDWFLRRLLGLEPGSSFNGMFAMVQDLLIESAMAQPMVCVHRDYHSRNLMVMDEGNPGVLDFQDAVIGPVTYDLVSLLRDCYIAWPEDRVDEWVAAYHALLQQRGLIGNIGMEQFGHWFDWMGLQRHLKAIGIFSRLKLREGRPGYLGDIPRTLNYISSVCGCYSELAGFHRFLQETVFVRMSTMELFE